MPKKRLAIRRNVRDAVLAEFNYRCAVCGDARPHLHHIDEDPSNGRPENIIPLCPNCHLVDQHNASNAVPQAKLYFFRRHKHRHILKPQFNPVFKRMGFLHRISDADEPEVLADRASELVNLVRNLSMGAFYGPQLAGRLARPVGLGPVVIGDPASEAHYAAQRLEQANKYREQLRLCISDVERLIVEMLDYQTWS